MKKITALFLSIILVFSLAACSGEQSTGDNSDAGINTASESTDASSSNTSRTSSQKENNTDTDSNILVVYFSMPETNKADNMTTEEDNSVVVIDGEVLGNTQYVAYVIQENTGANIFRIEPQTPYTTNHQELTSIAKQEQNNNARPRLKENVKNLDQYDTIFIGYPIWWGDMPMILYSFFDDNDLSGKKVIPFNTHGGSGFANTISKIAELEPNAQVNENGYSVSRDDVQEAEPDIKEWLKGLGY